ncbi:uncharacterized protein METZ01_LOCUS366015 [marine metagenome]|uniref:Uncharacterized protein n=1 Tax=marine metagenome TaxID=408172 RepID=A0A382SW65_9ZZZZ
MFQLEFRKLLLDLNKVHKLQLLDLQVSLPVFVMDLVLQLEVQIVKYLVVQTLSQ